jgi:hypothetical protein
MDAVIVFAARRICLMPIAMISYPAAGRRAPRGGFAP